MNNDNDNSIFFLTISLICIWLIVDYVVGKQYIGKFISMLPFMSGSGENNEVPVDTDGDGEADTTTIYDPNNPGVTGDYFNEKEKKILQKIIAEIASGKRKDHPTEEQPWTLEEINVWNKWKKQGGTI